jgi:ribonuclease P protein component
MNNRLPKAERIRGKRVIDSLFASGNRFNDYPFRVVWWLQPRQSGAFFRFGIAVPKKTVRKAHQRNRIKRLVRESLRLSVGCLRESLADSGRQLNFFLLWSGDISPMSTDIRPKIILILARLKAFNEAYPPSDTHRNDQVL